jgi:uncharacterized protein YlxP (DUF503 family)
MEPMHAAALAFDLHIPESNSLKAKRAVIKPIIEGLRHRFHVSVAEIEHQDTWQRARIGVAVVASSDGRLRSVIDDVERFVDSAPDVEVLTVDISWIEED